MRSIQIRTHYIITSLLLSCIAFPVQSAPEPETVSRVLKGERLNELGVWDLDGDNKFEIFVSGVTGKAGCYRADTLDPLWEKKISPSALTAPVIGDFMGTGAPILAFGASTGEILFVWPATGQVISTLETGSGFTLPPSVANFTDDNRQAIVLADDHGQLQIADLSADGLPRLRWTIPNTAEGSTAFSVVGQFSKPPSCADLNDDGTPEVVIPSESGILQVVSLSAQPTRHFTRLPQQQRPTTLAALGHLTGNNDASIILGVQANLQMFQWEPNGTGSVKQMLSSPAFGQSHGHLILGPVNTDTVADLISSSDNVIAARYLANDMEGKQVFLDIAQRHLTTTAAPLTPAVVYTKPDGSTAVMTIDSNGAVIEWQPASAENTVREVASVPVPNGFTPAGNLTGSGKLSIAAWTERDTKLSVHTLPIDIAADSPALLTLGSNYSRNGQWANGDFEEQLQRAEAALASAKEAYKSDSAESELTTTPASIIAGIAPQDPIAQELSNKRQRFSTKTIVLSVVLSLTGIAAIGLLWHFYRKRR